eukprot:gene8164-biopygen14534
MHNKRKASNLTLILEPLLQLLDVGGDGWHRSREEVDELIDVDFII